MALSNRDKRFIGLAEFVREWSKDPRTRVGAVLVGADPRLVALGYNGFPPGIADDDRLHDRGIKNMLIQHAERNVMDNARFETKGATLYTTRYPCHHCAGSIVSKGITRVVSCPPPTDPQWLSSSEWAETMFLEAGVKVDLYGEAP